MMLKKLCLFFIVCLIVSNSFAQKGALKKLEQIKPLESNEANVEAILGKAKKRYAEIGEYETKDGSFSVIYSKGKCTENSTESQYNVEKGIVVSIDFTPKRKSKFSSLEIDVSGFSVDEPEVADVYPSGVTYRNQKIGKSYSVTQNILKYVQVEPREDLWHLGCDRINK